MSARTWCLLWNEMITSSYKSHIRVWLHDWEKKKVAFTIYSYNHYWWLLMRNLIVLVFCESANFLLGQKYYEYMWFCQISVLERDFWISKHSLYIATWPKILWHYFEGGYNDNKEFYPIQFNWFTLIKKYGEILYLYWVK